MTSKSVTSPTNSLNQSPSTADDDNPFRVDFSKYAIREEPKDMKISAGPESQQNLPVATTADS